MARGVITVFGLFLFFHKTSAQFEYLYHGVVHTRDGSFPGTSYWKSEDGGWQGFAYKGIKYGSAGRFEPSTTNTDHSYLRNSSHPKNGYACPQTTNEYSGADSFPMSEDCLFLDVYVPAVYRHHSRLGWNKWPVLIWIHGGDFRAGYKDMFHGGQLAISIGAIVVVPNYRLGPFGFLSTQDNTATGNWALYDLKLALKWVHLQIQHFGGDHSKITLAGERAGGVLTSMMLMDEAVRELIHGAITFSGNMLSPWAIKKNPIAVTQAVAYKLDCANESLALVSCLRKVNVSELLSAASRIEKSAGLSLAPAFTPVIDGVHVQFSPSWLFESPAWTLQGGYVTGYSSADAAWPLLINVPRVYGHNTVDQEWILSSFIPALLEVVSECHPTASQLSHHSRDLYYRYGFSSAQDHREIHKRVVQMTTDAFYAIPAMKESCLYAKKSIANLGNQLYVISNEDNFDSESVVPIPDVLHLFGYVNTSSISNTHVNDAVTRELRRLVGHVVRHGYGFGRQFDANSGHRLLLGNGHEWHVANGLNIPELINFWDGLAKAGCSNP